MGNLARHIIGSKATDFDQQGPTIGALLDRIGFALDAFTPPNAPTTSPLQAAMQRDPIPL